MTAAKAKTDARRWWRVQFLSLLAAVVGGLVMAAGFGFNSQHFFRAYLVAFNFWSGIALGSLVLLMLQHLTGGAWGMLLRRILEAASGTIVLLLVLALPMILGLTEVYPWANAAAVAQSADLQHKSLYLNVPFFLARAGGYFLIWIALVFLLRLWSAVQDRKETSGLEIARRQRIVSGAGLVLYGLTITFASIDWVMSLEPRWYSTMFPPLFGVSQVLAAMAFAIFVLCLLSGTAPMSKALHANHRRDLGNLLLAFVMMWAYLSFSQFLLIWSEDLPEEIPWYLYRIRGGWEWVAMALVLMEFAIPFCLLLSRKVKEDPRRLTMVALLVLGMYAVNLFWWVEASFPGSMVLYWLLDVAAIVALGGIWVWFFIFQLKRKPLLPLADPYLPEYLPELSGKEAAHG